MYNELATNTFVSVIHILRVVNNDNSDVMLVPSCPPLFENETREDWTTVNILLVMTFLKSLPTALRALCNSSSLKVPEPSLSNLLKTFWKRFASNTLHQVNYHYICLLVRFWHFAIPRPVPVFNVCSTYNDIFPWLDVGKLPWEKHKLSNVPDWLAGTFFPRSRWYYFYNLIGQVKEVTSLIG